MAPTIATVFASDQTCSHIFNECIFRMKPFVRGFALSLCYLCSVLASAHGISFMESSADMTAHRCLKCIVMGRCGYLPCESPLRWWTWPFYTRSSSLSRLGRKEQRKEQGGGQRYDARLVQQMPTLAVDTQGTEPER